ncbi:UvrD-helicase domain-containing protein [Lacticaseibacillus suihuaensis]
MQTEQEHLTTIYNRLGEDITTLAAKLAAITQEGQAVKRELGSTGHLSLGSAAERLETFANLESGNRQIDTLNSRYDATATRLAHARLLHPAAYFAKLDLDYGDGEPESVYLGKVGYATADATDLIYDWRAPVADAYYANRIGATSFRANGQDIAITVARRLQLVVDHGRLVAATEAGAAVADTQLLAVLAQDRTGSLKEITATIQAEQNAVIRAAAPVLWVDGVAGSGKTSVLLQRVAYQLFQHRADWAPDSVLLLTPNRAFRRYIRGVLPALGEREPLCTTYAAFIRQLGDHLGLPGVTQVGNHLAALAGLLQQPLPAGAFGLSEAALRQTAASAPAAKRLQAAWRLLVAQAAVPADVSGWLDWARLAAAWGLAALTPYDRLYLLVVATGYRQPGIRAVFIDEAQDYDGDAWAMLAALFDQAALTIVGDHRQRLFGRAPAIADWFAGRQTKRLALTTSYRSTGAITAFFAQYAGSWAVRAVQPHGVAPRQVTAPDWAALVAALPVTPGQSVALIAPDDAAASALAAVVPEATLMQADDGSDAVAASVRVMALATAKGLEFDHVIVADWHGRFYADAQNGANRRYVAASRGTKTLTLVS